MHSVPAWLRAVLGMSTERSADRRAAHSWSQFKPPCQGVAMGSEPIVVEGANVAR